MLSEDTVIIRKMKVLNNGKKKIAAPAVILWIAIGSVLCSFMYGAVADRDNSTLQQVIILFRHGDRTPIQSYPNDPHINYPWPDGYGVLKKEGMLRMYKLGQWIRKKYGYLDNYTYRKQSTGVRSSAVDRCIMSTQAVLAGLFPPSPENAFTEDLNWRPIPVHYTPKEMDKVITVSYPCPILKKEFEKALEAEMKNRSEDLKLCYEGISNHSGKHIRTVIDLRLILDTLDVQIEEGLKLPEWTKTYVTEEIRQRGRQFFAMFTSNDVQKRLYGGPLLKAILGHMSNFAEGKNTENMHLYGVHDVTLTSVLRAMGISTYKSQLLKPKYGATLFFELWKNVDGHHQVLYMDDPSDKKSVVIYLLNCGEYCDLKDVLSGFENAIPVNWDAECQL